MKFLKLSHLTFLSLTLIAVDCHSGREFKPAVITSLSTTSGRVNSSVIITGANFNPNPANNFVQFGDIQAEVTAATATSLTVKVPNGSTIGKISVKVNTYSEAFSADDFTTTSFLDVRDNQEYGQVQVGTQWWMANNLNWDAWVPSPSDYCYQDNPVKCDEKGRLYVWPISPTFNINACPHGWRLPTETDFKALITNLGDSTTAKTALLVNGSSGLGVSYTGLREENGAYHSENDVTLFWSSSETNTTQAKALYISNSQNDVTINDVDKVRGICIRCIRY